MRTMKDDASVYDAVSDASTLARVTGISPPPGPRLCAKQPNEEMTVKYNVRNLMRKVVV